MLILAYIIMVGLTSGLITGLVGLGGGVIIVSAMIFLFTKLGFSHQHIMHLSTATSLAAMIFTGSIAVWSHHKRKTINLPLLKIFVPGTMSGAFFGVVLARDISSYWLSQFFACVTFLLAIYIILFTKEKSHRVNHPHLIIMILLAFVTGVLAGLIGIGGGIILVPIFLWLGLSMKGAAVNSIICALPTVMTGAISAMIIGWNVKGLPPMTLGYVYWPAALGVGVAALFTIPLGVHLAHRLPHLLIKRIFGILLLLIAWRMLMM